MKNYPGNQKIIGNEQTFGNSSRNVAYLFFVKDFTLGFLNW